MRDVTALDFLRFMSEEGTAYKGIMWIVTSSPGPEQGSELLANSVCATMAIWRIPLFVDLMQLQPVLMKYSKWSIVGNVLHAVMTERLTKTTDEEALTIARRGFTGVGLV